MEEKWIEELRQKMADYKEPAPEVSWDEIEWAVHPRVIPMWYRRIAAAVLVLIMAFAGYFALDHVKHTDRPHGSLMSQAAKPRASEEPRASENHEPAPLTSPSPSEEGESLTDSESGRTSSPLLQEGQGEVTPQSELEETSPSEAQDDTPSDTPEQEQKAKAEKKQTEIYYPQRVIYPSDLHKSPALRNRLVAKVYLSNAMGSSNQFSSMSNINEIALDPQDYPKPGDKADKADKGEKGDTGDNGYTGPAGPANTDPGDKANTSPNYDYPPEMPTAIRETATTTQNTHHYQPIRYGLSLRYRINRRWGIETGLTYSLLTSDVTNVDTENTTFIYMPVTSDVTLGGNEKTTQSKQRLNYIGIPLNAEYLLWDSRYFNLYVAAGMMVEKMVKGSLENLETGTKEGLSIRQLQFSVNGALGAEFNISRQFSIFAEPGIGYYFDNGSSVPTYYQDKPFTFNLNLGLRFQINGK